MSVQGQPAVIVPATTQTPKAIIPAEIRNESTVSMIGPLSSRDGGTADEENKRPAAPRRANRDAMGASQAAYRTRPKVNERNEPELRSKGEI
jgi:hypothetical protein